jgi:hypothetical protein
MATQHVDAEIEEPEGIGSSEDSSLGEYPLDTMLIRNESRTVHDVLRRIGQGNYIMDPDFQRDFIWPTDKQSKLIESVVMRIPLPVFYIAENEDGKVVVVDGLQRLSTFRNFVNDGLALRLPDRPGLNGKRFSDLSPMLQNRIEDCNLTLYVIDAKAPERARLDIFERVNGGAPLTRQQIRNALNVGPATRFLKEEATRLLFLKATGRSLNPAQMRDREFVNRFCGFQLLSRDVYRGEMDNFLADALKHMNQLDGSDLSKLSHELQTGLENNLIVFGEHAFRKHFEGQTRRSVINASLWDIMSTGLSRFPKEVVEDRADVLRDEFHALIKDADFIASITYGTNATIRVNHRFNAAAAMFQETLGA